MRPSSQDAVSTSSKLYMHRGSSHAITKLRAKPKIRIVHIIPPEVIKTSVEDFCEIVQRLTGKPAADGDNEGRGSGNNRSPMQMKYVESRDPMFNMLQKEYNNTKEESDHRGFSCDFWMNDFSEQDLIQFPLDVEDIIGVFSDETTDSMVSKYGVHG